MKTKNKRQETDEQVMVAYMLLKIRQRDWHGVADAAVDLQVMHASAVAVKRQYPKAKRIRRTQHKLKQ